MSFALSVIIPTHSPHPGRLERTFEGLRAQTLPVAEWEFVLVDNNSPNPISIDSTWHPNSYVIREEKLGLTHARRAGARAAKGELLVFADDDNVLDPRYLDLAIKRFKECPKLGAGGGRSIPEWEKTPESWVEEYRGTLALRDLGNSRLVARATNPPTYPSCAPIGAGLVIRRAAWDAYDRAISNDARAPLDRTGNDLSSGGDCDIVLHALEAGWDVGYLPELSLTHLIPAGRTTREYLARLNHGIAKSWVQVLDRHQIRLWSRIPKWTVPLRKWRAYFRNRAWAGPAEYVRWRGACGQFEGQALLR